MRLLHDLRVLTRAQRKKLSTSVTPKNGDTTDITAASTDIATDSGSKHGLTYIPSSPPIVETIEEDDSSVDSPSMPDLGVHHPSSDSDSGESDSSSCTPYVFLQARLKPFPRLRNDTPSNVSLPTLAH